MGPQTLTDFWAKLEGIQSRGYERPRAIHGQCARPGDIARCRDSRKSTSGTLGLGLACLVGVPAPVTGRRPGGWNPCIARMLTAYGAGVDMVTQPHGRPDGGTGAQDRVAQLIAGTPESEWYGNPDNASAPTGRWRWSWSRGLAGSMSWYFGRGRVDIQQVSPEVLGFSPGHAVIMREPSGPRLKRRVEQADAGWRAGCPSRSVAVTVHSTRSALDCSQAVWACRSGRSHYASGWSVGAVALVAGWAARNLPADVAAVFPDGPQRYFDTIYNDAYERTRTARRTTSHRARRDCLAAGRRRHPMNAAPR